MIRKSTSLRTSHAFADVEQRQIILFTLHCKNMNTTICSILEYQTQNHLLRLWLCYHSSELSIQLKNKIRKSLLNKKLHGCTTEPSV